MRRSVVAAVATLVSLGPATVQAGEENPRPWDRGTVAPSASLGFGYERHSLAFQFGVGIDYYALPGFSLGVALSDQILLYTNDLRARLPRVEEQIPTNLFKTTLIARYVFFRGRTFSPFFFAGLGPTVLNNNNGTFAHWTAGPGAYVHLTGGVWLDLGMNFEGMFPIERCADAFEYTPPRGGSFRAVDDFCSFRWGPRMGIVVAFGTRRGSKRSDSARSQARPRKRSSEQRD